MAIRERTTNVKKVEYGGIRSSMRRRMGRKMATGATGSMESKAGGKAEDKTDVATLDGDEKKKKKRKKALNTLSESLKSGGGFNFSPEQFSEKGHKFTSLSKLISGFS